jgi:protein TonB
MLKPVGSSALNATPVGTSQNDSVPDKVFTKVENEASFPGGQPAWLKYISKKVEASIDSFSDKDYGTCLIKFVVNTDGSVSNVEATTMEGTQLAKVSVNAVKEGPLWIPASQNGQTVAAYRLQPVTLTNPEEKKK